MHFNLFSVDSPYNFIVNITRTNASTWTWGDGHTISAEKGSTIWGQFDPNGSTDCATLYYGALESYQGVLCDVTCNRAKGHLVCESVEQTKFVNFVCQ
mgnify:CR=1 FL=1